MSSETVPVPPVPEAAQAAFATIARVLEAAGGPRGETRELPALRAALESLGGALGPLWVPVGEVALALHALGERYAKTSKRRVKKVYKTMENLLPDLGAAARAAAAGDAAGVAGAHGRVARNALAEWSAAFAEEGLPAPEGPALPPPVPAEAESSGFASMGPLDSEEVRQTLASDTEHYVGAIEAAARRLLEAPGDAEARGAHREAVHALRGAAAMAGLGELAGAIEDGHRLLEGAAVTADPAEASRLRARVLECAAHWRELLGHYLSRQPQAAAELRARLRDPSAAAWPALFAGEAPPDGVVLPTHYGDDADGDDPFGELEPLRTAPTDFFSGLETSGPSPASTDLPPLTEAELAAADESLESLMASVDVGGDFNLPLDAAADLGETPAPAAMAETLELPPVPAPAPDEGPGEDALAPAGSGGYEAFEHRDEPGEAPSGEGEPKVHGSADPVLVTFGDLDPVEEVDPELIVYFVQEYQENFQVIGEAFKVLERDPRSRDSWKTVHRLVHGTKGAANAMGLFRIGRLMSGVEEFVEAILDGHCHPPLADFRSLLGQIEAIVVDLEEQARGLRPRGDRTAELDRLARLVVSLWSASLGRAAAAAPAEPPAAPLPVAAPPPVELAVGAYVHAAEEPAEAGESEAVDPELLHFFVQEFRENDEAIGQALFNWEANPADEESQRTVFRLIHSTKGAANSMGLLRIGRLLHTLEDLLQEQLAGTIAPALRDVISLCFKSLDLTRALVREAEGAERVANAAERLRTLRDEIRRVQLSAPAPSAEAQRELTAAERTEAAETEDEGGEAPAAEGSGAAGPARGRAEDATIRIPTERLDYIMNLIGELVINRTRLEKKIADVVGLKDELNMARSRLLRLIGDFKEQYEYSGKARGAMAAPVDAPALAAARLGTPEMVREFSELELDRYDDFNILSRSLVEIGSDTEEIISELDRFFGSFADDTSTFSKITTALQDAITRIRMVPLRPLFLLLQRAVRDAGTKEGKDVLFVAEGGDVRMDKIVSDQCYAPLVHIVRNAVAHGIQSGERREARGKAAQGRITLRAYQESNMVVIEVSDDGEGLNFEGIRKKAVKVGLIQPDEVLDREELANLIFESGFSTTEQATEVSGRGVGLDAALREIAKLGGNINVISRDGLGCTFVVKVPLTMSINQAMVLRVSEEVFALPLNFVERVMEFVPERVSSAGAQEMLRVDERLVPLVRLRQLLDLPEDRTAAGVVVLAQVGDLRLALQADKILRRQDIVVKPLGSLLGRHPLFSGATLSGDGQIVLILDLPSITQLFRSHAVHRTSLMPAESEGPRLIPRLPEAAPVERGPVTILCVDDSLSIRNICVRYVTALGYRAEAAVDGLDALEKVRLGNYSLVLTDLEMPRLNGFELLAELRRQERTRDLPVVVVTSRDANKHRLHAQELGADDYIIKPFNQEQLGACIARLLKEGRQALRKAEVTV